MSKESRKQLASLSFAEKLRLLEKLRDRSMEIVDARKKLRPRAESNPGNSQ